jgi:acyl-CoA dehydrogenase
MVTDMHNEFRDTASRVFGDHVDAKVCEAAEAGQFPQRLWDAIVECGFGLVLVPESQGGIGAGLIEAASILEVAGEHAAPGPLLELILGNALLAAAGLKTSDEPIAVAFATGGATAGHAMAMRNVAWAQTARHVLVVAPKDGAAQVAVLAPGAATIATELEDASGEPMARVQVPADAVWRPLGGLDFDGWLRHAALLRGAQMAGAVRWSFNRTLEYTQERKQFGREIGKFQVVQQMAAELASSVIAAQAMLDAALDAPDDIALVSAARSRMGDTADTVFAIAHQVHGAIGFSYEYALHFRTRRLMAWRDQFGTVAYWRRILARGLAGRRADDIWPLLTA